jgi:hypothetical protein
VKQGEVEKMVMFVVYVKDEDDNIITIEEEHITIEVTDPSGDDVLCALMDNKDGTFSGAWQCEVAGDHSVHIMVDGVDIRSSPFTTRVVAKGRPLVEPGEGTGEHADEECMLKILNRDKDYEGWISEEGTCFNRFGDIIGFIWGTACGGSEEDFWGSIESDIVYNAIDTRVGEVVMDRGWLRDGTGRTIAEFDRMGAFIGNSGVFGGQFEGFSYHKMKVVGLYLLLVDSTLLNEYE